MPQRETARRCIPEHSTLQDTSIHGLKIVVFLLFRLPGDITRAASNRSIHAPDWTISNIETCSRWLLFRNLCIKIIMCCVILEENKKEIGCVEPRSVINTVRPHQLCNLQAFISRISTICCYINYTASCSRVFLTSQHSQNREVNFPQCVESEGWLPFSQEFQIDHYHEPNEQNTHSAFYLGKISLFSYISIYVKFYQFAYSFSGCTVILPYKTKYTYHY
jgi:hypothetical protein